MRDDADKLTPTQAEAVLRALGASMRDDKPSLAVLRRAVTKLRDRAYGKGKWVGGMIRFTVRP